MDPKQAWKQWRSEIEREAADIDAAANLLDRAELQANPVMHAGLGSHGRTALDEALASIRVEHARCVGSLRVKAKALRLDAEHAKWLGDPKRAAALDVVAMTDPDVQREAMVRLPTVTATAVRNRNLHRRRAGEQPRIDRIVAGARLYAATKVKT